MTDPTKNIVVTYSGIPSLDGWWRVPDITIERSFLDSMAGNGSGAIRHEIIPLEQVLTQVARDIDIIVDARDCFREDAMKHRRMLFANENGVSFPLNAEQEKAFGTSKWNLHIDEWQAMRARYDFAKEHDLPYPLDQHGETLFRLSPYGTLVDRGGEAS
jgi:hypothetical protein